ncbi:ABC transporter substrate-binding protein [Ilumatobacter sp.]|uniref:ABC transporter substrate-binding protein n=1 Tax=Ilumatobacter sp. TaxID=1967498 RepID=UPI002A26872C|nr:ABC transporter substrate-binding protein [Ilumatobacter sp.]
MSTSIRRSAWAITFALAAAACGGGSDSSPSSEPATSDIVASDEGTEIEPDATPVATDAAAPPASDDGSANAVVEEVVEEELEPVAGGTLRMALEADAGGLNPTSSALTASGLNMANAVFDTLAAIGADGAAVPYLAESIEPVDGDLTLWRMRLRPGIVFHDGTPLDAAAVKTNFDTQLASPLVSMAIRPFFPTDGAVTVVDDLTVDYQVLEPNSTFPSQLTGQLGMMASPTWLAAAAEDATLNQAPVGTGPFVIDSREQDSVTRFVRNDAWWGGEVYLDAVEFLPVPDPSTRNDLAFNGDVQMIHTVDPASSGDLLEDDDLQSVLDETGEENFIMLNAAVPPFDDLRVRQALTYATPLQNVRDLIGLGIARPADQMFTPDQPYFNPDVVQEGDDPERALELVSEYCTDVPEGCSDGKVDIVFSFGGGTVAASREAEILEQGWKVGFNVEFNEIVQDSLVVNVATGQYQTTTWRQFGGIDPTDLRQNLMCRTVTEGISLNFARFCSEERDALIVEAQATVDPEARIPLWQAVVKDMQDAYSYIFTRHSPWVVAFDPDVRGVCDRTSPDGTALRCVSNGRTWFDSTWIV